MLMLCPGVKPLVLATGIAFAPSSVAAPVVVPPAVPTAAMTAVSRFAPVSIWIVWPGSRPSTAVTLTFVAPDFEAPDKLVAGDVTKSVQLLSVSAPSGKRPALVFEAAAAAAKGPKPLAAPGAVT